MKKATMEYVTMFTEDGVPVGMLTENGHREFYHVVRASKAQVAELLEVDTVEPKV